MTEHWTNLSNNKLNDKTLKLKYTFLLLLLLLYDARHGYNMILFSPVLSPSIAEKPHENKTLSRI